MTTTPTTEIVAANKHDRGEHQKHSDRSTSLNLSLEDIYYLAQQVAAAKLFPGFDTVPQTFTLMMICQSEGLHPMQALRRYDVIKGKPALKAAAIQAEFIARGGVIRFVRLDDEEARAVFSHPKLMPEPVERFVTYSQFENTYARNEEGKIKRIWTHSRSDMLWARLMTFCRKIDPGIATGIPITEDLAESENLAIVPPQPSPTFYSPASSVTVYKINHETYQHFSTYAASGFLSRLKESGIDPGGFKPASIHAYLVTAAVDQGLMEKPRDRKTSTVLLALSELYKSHHEWVESTTHEYLDNLYAEAASAHSDDEHRKAFDQANAFRDSPESPVEDRFIRDDSTEREPGEDG